jgi:hypothetical protein
VQQLKEQDKGAQRTSAFQRNHQQMSGEWHGACWSVGPEPQSSSKAWRQWEHSNQ